MPETSPEPSLASPSKSPLWEMLTIAAPVVATMTSYTLMQFVDKLMVSRIGPDPIYVGAQGNGGIAAWAPISIMMGFVTVINTFVSQNLGANKPERGAAYVWAGIWLNLAFYIAMILPIALVLPWLFEAIRDTTLEPAELARAVERDQLAAGYGRILLYAAFLTMACRAVSQYFYGLHKPMVVMIASILGNITNIVLNSFLIYGPTAPASTGEPWLDAWLGPWFAFCASTSASLGIPRMGINGAAYATVAGTLVELAIPLLVFLSPKYNRLYHTRAPWRISLPHIRDLLRIGWAPALNFGNEMVCWTIFMVYLVGAFGPMHSTAGWIAHQWMTLSFMPTVGISVAITAMVGKSLGANKPDEATQRAWLGVKVAATYMTLCGLLFFIFRDQLIGWFVDPSTPAQDRDLILSLGAKFLIAAAAFQLFDGIAMTLSGALKGAGDTKWPSVATMILSWSIIVVGGLALVKFAPNLGSVGPWIAAAAYIFAVCIFITARFLTGHWKNIHLLKHSAP